MKIIPICIYVIIPSELFTRLTSYSIMYVYLTLCIICSHAVCVIVGGVTIRNIQEKCQVRITLPQVAHKYLHSYNNNTINFFCLFA